MMDKKYQYECTVRLETAWWFPVKKAANKEEFIKQITKEFSDDGFDIKRSDICHINTDNPNEKNEGYFNHNGITINEAREAFKGSKRGF